MRHGNKVNNLSRKTAHRKSMLSNMQSNLVSILNIVVIVLSIFFLWLLAAQVVILSQGWELYQGTADRMEGDEANGQSA